MGYLYEINFMVNTSSELKCEVANINIILLLHIFLSFFVYIMFTFLQIIPFYLYINRVFNIKIPFV